MAPPSARFLDADGLSVDDTLLAIRDQQLLGAVVRGVYGTDEVAAIVERLDRGLADLAQTRDRADDAPQARTLGIPISPSDLYPRGPDPGPYLDAADPFKARCDALFAPSPALAEALDPVLSALAGGRPVVRAVHPDGRAYGEMTVRILPIGGGLPPHSETSYRDIAVYDGIREGLQLDDVIGFFVPLQLPEEGGQLVVYGVPFARTGGPFQGHPLDIVEDVPHAVLTARPGDLVLVGSGAWYHQVTRIRGTRERWTVGGFGAFTTDGERFVRWA